VNLYAYAGNNPISFSDPYGLCPWCVGAALGAAVSGTVQVAANLAQGRPATEHLGRALLIGAVVGGTFGAAAPEATAAFGARVAIGGAAAATTAGAAGAAASGKTPFEGFQDWGRNVVNWGTKASGAIEATENMTAEMAAKIDPAKVQAAKIFYENAVANGKGADAAAARVQLMQKILDLQSK
jgi:hypothetical protein